MVPKSRKETPSLFDWKGEPGEGVLRPRRGQRDTRKGKDEGVKVRPGMHVTLEGATYQVLQVTRGEGKARALARTRPGLFYRVVYGQWCVLKKNTETPDYVLR